MKLAANAREYWVPELGAMPVGYQAIEADFGGGFVPLVTVDGKLSVLVAGPEVVELPHPDDTVLLPLGRSTPAVKLVGPAGAEVVVRTAGVVDVGNAGGAEWPDPPVTPAVQAAIDIAVPTADTLAGATATGKTLVKAADPAAVVAAIGAVAQGSMVTDIGNPTFSLPSNGTSANAAWALAYAATPTGGILDCGNRSIVLTAQVTIFKKITIRNGTFLASGVRPFLVSAANVTFENCTITRTGAAGTDGTAISFNGVRSRLIDCTVTSTCGDAVNYASGNCDYAQIRRGYYETTGIGNDAFAIQAKSGTDNVGYVIDGATIRNSGFGGGIGLYNMSKGTVTNCDVQAIRSAGWFDVGTWTLSSGTTWIAADRTDINSNAVWVGTIAAWDSTKVEYPKSGTFPAADAGNYTISNDGTQIAINLSDGTNPNLKRIRTRKTDGYGILFYDKSSTTGMSDNVISFNRVTDTDGFGIYYQMGLLDSQNNRTLYNTCTDVCKLGVAVGTLPFAGIGFLGGYNYSMIGDTVIRAGTTTYPVPCVKVKANNSGYMSGRMTSVYVTGGTGDGFQYQAGDWKVAACRSVNNTGNGFVNFGQVASSTLNLELTSCEGISNTLSGGVFSGGTQTTRISVVGGYWANNGLRGIQYIHCAASKVVDATFAGNANYAVSIGSTSQNNVVGGCTFENGNGLSVSSDSTGFTLLANSEDFASPIKYLISAPFWRVGYKAWKGTGTPEAQVTSEIGGMYTRVDGGAGTTLYIKESGTGNTGWVAK